MSGRAGASAFGNFSLINGAWFICDAEIEIGDIALISWNVVLMEAYRVAFDARPSGDGWCGRCAAAATALAAGGAPARPIRIGRHVWIGFDAACCPA